MDFDYQVLYRAEVADYTEVVVTLQHANHYTLLILLQIFDGNN